MTKVLALAGVSLVAVAVAGSARGDTVTGSITSSDPTQTGRVAPAGGASVCGAQKLVSTTGGAGFHYDATNIQNATATPRCVTVTLTTGAVEPLFAVAYCPSFDPANVAANYVADPGMGASNGRSVIFSFTMAAGATCTLVVSEVTAGSCGAAGCEYTLEWTTPAVAATFRSLSAVSTAHGALVRWRTASEENALGFNVYRASAGRRVRVNPRLIAARGAGAYAFLDRAARRVKSARYWIQLVNLDGSRSWYGPARLARP